MDTETVSTADPKMDIERLNAEINAQHLLLDGIDQALGSLYATRKIGVERLFDLQSRLATLKHHSALAREARS